MRKALIAAVCILLGAVGSRALFDFATISATGTAPIVRGTSPEPSTYPTAAETESAVAAAAIGARHYAAAVKSMADSGLETNSAGFHARAIAAYGTSSSVGSTDLSDFMYVHVPARESGLFPLRLDYSRTLSSSVIVDAHVIPDSNTTGKFAVQVMFDERGITELRRLVKVVIGSADQAIDWAGNVPPNGTAGTPMRLYLVSNTKYFGSFEAIDLITNNRINQYLTVASGIDSSEATAIVAALGH